MQAIKRLFKKINQGWYTLREEGCRVEEASSRMMVKGDYGRAILYNLSKYSFVGQKTILQSD